MSRVKAVAVLNALLTGVLAVCAVAVTVVIVKRELKEGSAVAGGEFRRLRGAQEFHSATTWIGDPQPSVRISVYSDFECPFCARLALTLDSIMSRYPTGVAWSYRHFPLTALHPTATEAAIASECARAQGKFKAFHDVLFARQALIPSAQWGTLAASAGVTDTVELATCVAERRHADVVRADSVLGASAKIGGTPTVVVNGWVFAGAPTIEQLSARIDLELRERNN